MVIFFCLNISLFSMECSFPLLSHQKYSAEQVGHVKIPFCLQCRDSCMSGIDEVTTLTGALDSAEPDCTLQSQPTSAVHKRAVLCTESFMQNPVSIFAAEVFNTSYSICSIKYWGSHIFQRLFRLIKDLNPPS